jgi:hypothetical protein
MERSEIKKQIISSLDADSAPRDITGQLEDIGISFDFSEAFTGKIIEKISITGLVVNREMEFIRNLSSAFYRIALTGVAAIVILLISIYLMEGSISMNSFLGLGDTYDESIICLLTGN